MDLEVARKALPKRSTFSSKRVAFFGLVGLCVVAGILLRSGSYFTQKHVEQNAPAATVAPSPPPTAPTPPVDAPESAPQPQVELNEPAAIVPSPAPIAATPPAQNAATTPTEQAEPTGEAVDEPKPVGEADEASKSELPGSGMILVAKQPVAVLASPSSSAPALYGFPAGRPFRVIGREGGFAHIQDLKSSASGWIDEAALAQPPREPEASAPPQPRPFSAGRKPTQKDGAVSADSEVATQPDRRRPGLFGRGGLFGGIFGNGN
jgi:hypothetical protein